MAVYDYLPNLRLAAGRMLPPCRADASPKHTLTAGTRCRLVRRYIIYGWPAAGSSSRNTLGWIPTPDSGYCYADVRAEGVGFMIVGKPSRRTYSAEELRREYEAPFIMDAGRVRDVTRGPFPSWAETAAVVATTTAVVPYVQAIATELGKRTVEVAPKAYRGISCRLRFRGRGSKALVEAAEIEVRLDSVVTTVVLTKELPDEARLMLLDLDLTSDEFRGKALRWDSTAGAWLPFTLRSRRRWLKRKSQPRL